MSDTFAGFVSTSCTRYDLAQLIRIQVWDEDWLSADDQIGEAKPLPVRDLVEKLRNGSTVYLRSVSI